MWGISDITHVCIRGKWRRVCGKVWAPEVSDKGVTVVDGKEVTE